MINVETDVGLQEWQLSLIRDAISGLVYHLPREDVMFLPFLDCISLLHQRRVVYALWRRAAEGPFECKKVFLRDPTYLARFAGPKNQRTHKSEQRELATYLTTRAKKDPKWVDEIAQIPSPSNADIHFGISVHQLDAPRQFLDPSSAVLNIDHEATKQLIELLQRNTPIPWLSTSLVLALHKTATHYSSSPQSCPVSRHGHGDVRLDLSDNEVHRLLAPMTDALNQIVSDLGQLTGSLRIQKNGLPNLFAIARVYSFSREKESRYYGQFDYTCRFMLLDKTRRWLERKVAKKGLDVQLAINTIQQPLPRYMRSIADLAFSNETVTFKLDPNDGGLSAVEQDCQEIDSNWTKLIPQMERWMYPQNAKIFYVPIHVCLTPWLTLYTLTDDTPRNGSDKGAAWHHNYLFYRQLVHTVAVQVRQKARDVYVKLFGEFVVNGMRDPYQTKSQIVQGINRNLKALAQIYPFPMGFLTEEFLSEGRIDLGSRGSFSLALLDNPYFQTTLADCNLTLKEITAHSQQLVDDFLAIEEVIYSSNEAHLSHVLTGQLGALCRAAREQRVEVVEKIASNIQTFHNVAEISLNPQKNELYLPDKIEMRTPAFYGVLETEYRNALSMLKDAYYNGTFAQTFRRNGTVLESVSIRCELDAEAVISYSEIFIPIALEGLLKNVMTHMDTGRPFFDISVTEVQGKVLLILRNSLKANRDLRALEHVLNHPPPQLIGVRQLHRISRVFWSENSSDFSLPSWSIINDGDLNDIVVKIQVGVIG